MNTCKRILTSLLLLLILLLHTGTASAQNYSFQLTRSLVDVFLEADGSATIQYVLDFANDAGASPIDFVDIGLPNDNYSLSQITASVDGQPITDIEHSPYVTHGIALGLGSGSIQPGQSGRVEVRVPNVTGILFPGTEKETEDYASFQFMPNYFDSQFVNGNTDLTVTIHLPSGIEPEEPRYYPPKNWPGSSEPESGFDEQGRIFYRWQSAQADGSSQYTFGCAFPARIVPESAITTPPPATINFEDLCCVGGVIGFIGFFVVIIVGSIYGSRKRKLQYLPPKISIEGHGIKRGLTAIEAAVLMEQPLDKILTMILFSAIKKEAATVVSRDPLKIEAADPLPESLQEYEVDFLNAMKKKESDRRKDLQDLMIKTVKSVQEKMKGFSRKETVDYYKKIVDQAWEYVEKAETPEVKMKKFDEVMDWTLLDRKYDDRTRDVFRTGPVFVPTWWGRWDPTFNRPAVGGGHMAAPPNIGGTGGSISLPTLPGSDFAVSMVNGIQNFSSKVVGDITSFTGGITDKTNPVPKTITSSSRGGRSGGGCACACACACAGCACACAGGGR